MTCPHQKQCPTMAGADREAARVLVRHPEQGWSLLCNGVILFDDTGELLPDGSVVVPHRGAAPERSSILLAAARTAPVPTAA